MILNMSQTEESCTLLVLCRDLLFASKIGAAAKTVNVPVKMLRDASKLNDETQGRRLIVDLTQEGFIESAAQWKQRTQGRVTGFAGHADMETIDRARAVGIDDVMAKGAFVARLSEILRDQVL
jgi:hypothetical protein